MTRLSRWPARFDCAPRQDRRPPELVGRARAKWSIRRSDRRSRDRSPGRPSPITGGRGFLEFAQRMINLAQQAQTARFGLAIVYCATEIQGLVGVCERLMIISHQEVEIAGVG